LIPGLPTLPFLVIGALLYVASRARNMRRDVEHRHEPIAPAVGKRTEERAFVPVVTPWQLDVSSDLAPLLDDEVRGREVKRPGIRSAAAAARELLFRQFGVPLPACRCLVSHDLPPRHVVISLHELPAKVIVVPDDLPDTLLAESVLTQLMTVLSHRAHEFLGLTETQNLLDQLEQHAPATVRQVVPKPVALTTLTDVLRRLVEEGVSIRDLKLILEALAQVASTEKDPLNLAEFVRSQMRRSITYKLTQGASQLEVCLLDPQIEETIRSSISRTGAGSFLTLAPAAGRDIVEAVKQALAAPREATARRPVLLTQPDIRRFVRKLVETDLPELVVVSYADLLPELNLKPAAKASLRLT